LGISPPHRLPQPVFTPDSTHYPIAKLALESGHHVMVTKPATQLLEHHQELSTLAAKKGLVCWVEQYVLHHRPVPIRLMY
jgi:predicted dehydrogenase